MASLPPEAQVEEKLILRLSLLVELQLALAEASSGKPVEAYLLEMRPVIRKAVENPEYSQLFTDSLDNAANFLQHIACRAYDNHPFSPDMASQLHKAYLKRVVKQLTDLSSKFDPQPSLKAMSVLAVYNTAMIVNSLVSPPSGNTYSQLFVDVSRYGQYLINNDNTPASNEQGVDNISRRQILDSASLRSLLANMVTKPSENIEQGELFCQ